MKQLSEISDWMRERENRTRWTILFLILTAGENYQDLDALFHWTDFGC